MDHRVPPEYYPPDLHFPKTITAAPSASVSVVFGILALYALRQFLVYLDHPILSPPELLWNALVALIPAPLILSAARRQELREQGNMLSQTHAAKSEVLRRALGVGGSTLTKKFTRGEGIMRSMSTFSGSGEESVSGSDGPPGLGNWDNSCYQNSVLQGLSSLTSLTEYLAYPSGMSEVEARGTTIGSLREMLDKLNGDRRNGSYFWTPTKLKSMSSWQQQDAQEYFSKIMDELDKETAKAFKQSQGAVGLELAVEDAELRIDPPKKDVLETINNPLEGLLAQRVACTRCGFSDGMSMIPFNCLTVPLGPNHEYELSECLDEYTKLEEINDVECAKCTLLSAEGKLNHMLSPFNQQSEAVTSSDSEITSLSSTSLALPPELRVLAAKRLAAIRKALESDDFSDRTLKEFCQISKKSFSTTTKTRQAVIGRAPRSLVVHVNRSVFDEFTGIQSKNYASVKYPLILDLERWILSEHLAAASEAMTSLLGAQDNRRLRYRLKAVVTHYGRHENGHYICYRQHPAQSKKNALTQDCEGVMRWWRLSDEDVSPVSEENVLAQHGVFMLFYERERDAKWWHDGPEVSVSLDTKEGVAMLKEQEHDKILAAEAAVPLPKDDDEVPVFPGEGELSSLKQPPQEEVPLQAIGLPSTSETSSSAVIDEKLGTVLFTGTTTDDESEATDFKTIPPFEHVKTSQKPVTPSMMRTSHGGRQGSGGKGSLGEVKRFGNPAVFRPMAAT